MHPPPNPNPAGSPILLHPEDQVTRPMWCVLTRPVSRPIGSDEWDLRGIAPTHAEAQTLALPYERTHAFEVLLLAAVVTVDLRGVQ